MRGSGLASRHHGGTPKDLWRTPPALFAVLNAQHHFALDAACTTADCLCPAGLYADDGHDGLREPWRSVTWCNPPYGRMRPWIVKAAEEARRGVRSVLLVPAAVGANWWQIAIPRAERVIFIVGRLKFHGPSGEALGVATFPSAVLVLGPEAHGHPPHVYLKAHLL